MELVQAFNAELSSLYEVKPPISKAKMSQITKVAIKGIKMYKHIVQSVERFIAKCRPEYKIPGLYVIDSIVRQSRHQFGAEKDVFGPRFTRNFNQTFQNLFLTCPQEDKPKIVRVLNLWQRNNVFSSEIIQPLLDMANPNANLGQIKYEGSPSESVNNDLPSGSNKADTETNLVLSLHKLATTLGLVKNSNNGTSLGGSSAGVADSGGSQQNTIRFDKKLLDFDYSEDEDDEKSETPTEAEPPTSVALNNEDANTNPLALSMAQNLLSNPELLQRLQQMQQTIQQHQDNNSQLNSGNIRDTSDSSFISSFQPIIDSKATGSHHEMDTSHNDINLPTREMQPEKAPADAFNYQQNVLSSRLNARLDPVISSSGPMVHPEEPTLYQSRMSRNYSNDNKRDYDYNGPDRDSDMRNRSRSRSPRRNSRFQRSSYRDKDERVKRSRSRSPWRSSNDRRNYESRSPRGSRRGERISLSPESKEREKERERERERRRRGLPQIRKGYLTICSTTLWLGHVPKLVSEADISNTFGEFGTINSIDLIPPRGCAYVCMNRRQDAYRALNQLKNLKLHGSTIKMAWAPGKGMKGKEFKDYWDVELGASYIPYEKLDDDVDIELLEDGGMIDEDTVPEKLKEIRTRKAKEKEERMIQATMLTQPPLISVPPMVAVPGAVSTAVPPVPPAAPPFGMPLPSGLVPSVVQPSVPVSLAQPVLTVGIPPPPPPVVIPPGSTGIPLPGSSIVTTATSNMSNPSLSNEQSKTNEVSPASLLPNQLGSSQTQFAGQNTPILTTTIAKTVSSTSSIDSAGMMIHSAPPVFQGLPLNVPPPSVLSVQRPPPMPWLTGPPPPILGPGGTSISIGSSPSKPTGDPSSGDHRNISESAPSPKSDYEKRDENRESSRNSYLNTNRDPIPPPLHGHDMQGDPSSERSSKSNDRPRDRYGREQQTSGKKDPFSPPHYELNKPDRDNASSFERTHDGLRMPLHGRSSLDNHPSGSGDRFFDRGHKRDWHMRGPPQGTPPSSGPPGMLHPSFEENSRNSLAKPLGGPPPPPPPHSFPLGPPPSHFPPHHDSFAVRPPPLGREWGRREEWRGGRNNRFGGPPVPRGSGSGRFNRPPRDDRGGPPVMNRWTKDRHGHRIDSLRDRERGDRDRDRDRSRERGETERTRDRESYRDRESREQEKSETHDQQQPSQQQQQQEQEQEPKQSEKNDELVDINSTQMDFKQSSNDKDDSSQQQPVLNEFNYSEKPDDTRKEEISHPVDVNDITKTEESQVT